jgi:antitoxin ParD1/3/4
MSDKTTIRKTISMPAEMGKFVEERVRSGQYGNDSEYFRELVRRDREDRLGIAALQAAFDEGRKGKSIAIKPSEIRTSMKQRRPRTRRA